jgi:hypothetical protein
MCLSHMLQTGFDDVVNSQRHKLVHGEDEMRRSQANVGEWKTLHDLEYNDKVL